MITFQIYLAAKTVKEALAMRAQLIDGGVKEDSISFPSMPTIARSASPVSDKSAECIRLENDWRALTGKGFRCSPEMASMFKLPDDREGRIREMITLVKAKKAVRTVSGWMPASAVSKADILPTQAPDDDGEETF